ncbi:MAG: septal ring lytic transglycosylase RlpA family protein [Pseudomonadota bacterium]
MPRHARPALAAVVLCITACQWPTSGPTAPPASDAPQSNAGSRNDKTDPYVVLGKRYVPLKSAVGYRERGVASWYGPNFHGKPTANGERFDMNAMTAAHKTLPLPTYAEVTNLRNGRRVVVRINDRGPFVDNRLIDLSRAAARALDMVGPGTTLVDVRVVPGPGGGPIEAPAASTPESAKAFYIQVGAYGERTNADRVAKTLNASGFLDVQTGQTTVDGRTVHRVRIGPVDSVDQFDRYIYALHELGFNSARLAVD